MKSLLFLGVFSVGILVASNNRESAIDKEQASSQFDQKYVDSVNLVLKKILDTAHVEGSILMYDVGNNIFYSNDYDWAKVKRLPASTFKIPNSIIALETGIVENDSTLFEWNGEKRRMKIWEQDLTFAQAYSYSCVPCYQEIARKVGTERMNLYLKKFEYGDELITDSMLDLFWLDGSFGISQYDQIEFLRKLQADELKISKRTTEIMRRVMITLETPNAILRGKTGWAISNGKDNGWYVGYTEQDENVFIVVTNLEPKPELNLDLFKEYRLSSAVRALEVIGVEF